jgi:hypothetical protein
VHVGANVDGEGPVAKPVDRQAQVAAHARLFCRRRRRRQADGAEDGRCSDHHLQQSELGVAAGPDVRHGRIDDGHAGFFLDFAADWARLWQGPPTTG